jgi:hypothetical protein
MGDLAWAHEGCLAIPEPRPAGATGTRGGRLRGITVAPGAANTLGEMTRVRLRFPAAPDLCTLRRRTIGGMR